MPNAYRARRRVSRNDWNTDDASIELMWVLASRIGHRINCEASVMCYSSTIVLEKGISRCDFQHFDRTQSTQRSTT